MASSTEDFQKHIRTYLMVGATLFVFTIVTVVLGYFPMFDLGAPGVTAPDIVLGLAIASFKTSLVMLIFMHLNHERGLIYKVLLFTSAFAVALMGLTLFALGDPVHPHSDVMDRTVIPVVAGHGGSPGDGHGAAH